MAIVIICTIITFLVVGFIAFILQGILYFLHLPFYSDTVAFIIACIGGTLGFWFGKWANLSTWETELKKDIDAIERLVYREDLNSLKSCCCDFIEKYQKKHLSNNYRTRFNSEKQNLIAYLQDALQTYTFKKWTDNKVAISASTALYILTSDTKFEAYIKQLGSILDWAGQFPLCIEFVSYGNCGLPFDDPSSMQKLDDNALRILNHYDNAFTGIKNAQSFDTFENALQMLDENVVYTLCLLMWYFAKHTPIDIESFKKARFLYQVVTIPGENGNVDDEVSTFATMEDLLASIYVRNLFNLETGKKEEEEYINSWITSKMELGEIDDCFRMCSGLAWIDANNYEKDILLKLFSAQIQLPEHLQERLTHLSSGEKNTVQLYRVEPSNLLLYDASSSEWDIKDYDYLFYESSLKRIRINYSLAIESFSKVIPLQSGTKSIDARISNELTKLMSDYDGSIIRRVVSAKAVNVVNDVIVDGNQFVFNIEQCPCGSVLFLAEKYGRTLNVNLITLFTPDNNVDSTLVRSYVTSLKNNSYIISFRESLLQVIDDVVTESIENIYEG